MCLEIGNKVAVLDDVIKGVVVRITGEDVWVKTDDEMEIVFKKTELVKIGVDQIEISKRTRIDGNFLKKKEVDSFKKKKSSFIKDRNEVVMEVDLHIEKLVKSKRGMDNYDILSIQMDVAKRKVEYCIQKKISKIIFIHGVGEGVLKSELHYLLNRYPVKFYDASYQKYGLGATEVYVFQNH
ncbi:Smr/MutS family protein [uncultured Tenacibaculum sp.]|uniref:Smr/MutS family protein n=1 Tax=uncultured Tenacibaculum sp. TaxID=174713 RepID=UPI00262A218C|nr:Smr/MutS family protein [uncultured Tenacibaculum sp.]